MSQFKKNNPEAAYRYFTDRMTFTTGPVELKKALEIGTDLVLIDVREKKDFDVSHLPGAISLPKTEWESLKGLSTDHLHVIYCYSEVCHLGARACIYFADRGYSVMELQGGYKSWEEHKLPIEGPKRRLAA